MVIRCFLPGLALLLMMGGQPLKADTRADLEFLRRPKAGPVRVPAAEAPPSELKLAARFMIRLYQTVISSQDLHACVFIPSCSRFSMAAIERRGMIEGALMTFDRLQRCHGYSRSDYSAHPGTGLRADPVEHECLSRSCRP